LSTSDNLVAANQNGSSVKSLTTKHTTERTCNIYITLWWTIIAWLPTTSSW